MSNVNNSPLSDPASSLMRRFTLQRVRELCIRFSIFLCALLSIATTLGIILVLVNETIVSIPGMAGKDHEPFFQLASIVDFLTGTEWSPEARIEPQIGVLPLICGTLQVAVIASLVGLPMGILSAVYLSEYAPPRVRTVIKPILEILAGIPTVVYGFFALDFITPHLLKPVFEGLFGMEEGTVGTFNMLSAGIVVGIMVIPMVSSLSEDALRAVPRSLREAGYALGSTKFHVSVKIVLPAAFSGIVASFLLAVSRAIGETMAVAIAGGSARNLTLNPLESVQAMTSFIVHTGTGDAATGQLDYQAIYAVALCLFVMTLLMNVVSQWVMRRYREVYD